jgi:hypothetical protein
MHCSMSNLLVVLPQQVLKFSNPIIHLPNHVTLSPVHSARNFEAIFDSNLIFSQHISTVSKSCFYHIRDLRHIRNLLIILQPLLLLLLIHSKLEYCNSHLLNLPSPQTKRLQLCSKCRCSCCHQNSLIS